MKITDGKRTVEINIMTWNGAGCGPDWAGEYFNAGALPYDEEKGCLHGARCTVLHRHGRGHRGRGRAVQV